MTALPAEDFLAGLTDLGASLVTGVPCSYLAGPLQQLQDGGCHQDLPYVPAVNEGSALAMAAGATLSGGLGAVLSQNSGFGNLINPLTSLILPYRLPVLVALTMRGWPVAESGEEQHYWMGQVVPLWLESLHIPFWHLAKDQAWPQIIEEARQHITAGTAVFLLVGKGAVSGGTASPISGDTAGITRSQLIDIVAQAAEGARILSTTGYLSRELFHRGDGPLNFYMQGSMGHIASVALGAALTQPDHRFVILDGDGAVFMHLGVLASIGRESPRNIVHIVFDNGSYESTGGQPTGLGHADLTRVALACGYRSAVRAEAPDGLSQAIHTAMTRSGPSLIVARGRSSRGASNRPSSSITPAEIARRFRINLDGTRTTGMSI